MDKKKFGEFIKEARIAKNLTQAKLAEELCIDVTAVSKWERGVNYPDISMIEDICRCLDITEHELIESSRDTEFRQTVYNSKQYLKNKRIAFWSITSCFLVAVLTCFIVELCVSHTLSWFFIVLTGCALGYWAIMYPILYGRLKKRLNEDSGYVLSKFSLLIYAAGLLILTLAVLLTTYVRTSFDIGFAVKTTLYCFLILFAYGVVELLNCKRMVKLGIDSILTGAFFVSLAKVLPALMKVEEENYFDVDFLDWAGHSNGNVAVLILALFTIGGVLLIVFGARGKQKAQ